MAETNKSPVELLAKIEPELFWQQQGRKIVWGLVAVLAIVVVVVHVQRQAAERENEAAVRVAQAADPDVLLQLARAYPGKNVGAQALLRAADLQSQAGRFYFHHQMSAGRRAGAEGKTARTQTCV